MGLVAHRNLGAFSAAIVAAGTGNYCAGRLRQQPVFNLPAGTYQAEVAWGNAKKTAGFEVTAGKLVEVPLVVNAGTLMLSAVMAEGTAPAPDELAWDVYTEANAEGERAKVGFSYDAQPKLRFGAGKYLVTVKRGGVVVESEVEVTAGKLNQTVISLNAGMLKLSSAAKEGTWDLWGPQNAEGNRKKLFFSYDQNVKVAVPAGKILIVRTEGEKKAEKEIEVKANTLTEMTQDAK